MVLPKMYKMLWYNRVANNLKDVYGIDGCVRISFAKSYFQNYYMGGGSEGTFSFATTICMHIIL